MDFNVSRDHLEVQYVPNKRADGPMETKSFYQFSKECRSKQYPNHKRFEEQWHCHQNNSKKLTEWRSVQIINSIGPRHHSSWANIYLVYKQKVQEILETATMLNYASYMLFSFSFPFSISLFASSNQNKESYLGGLILANALENLTIFANLHFPSPTNGISGNLNVT